MFDPGILRLIAITDALCTGASRGGPAELVHRAAAAVRGGATCIQIRLKDVDTRTLVEVARLMVGELPVPVIVNDRLDVALASGAAGVHLGVDDLPVSEARRLATPGFIIGASVGCDEEVPNAHDADYVGIGPIFSTLSKPDAGQAIGVAEFARLVQATGLPAVAVGGVTAENFRQAMETGAAGVAVLSGIFGAEDPEKAAMKFSGLGLPTSGKSF